LKAVTLLVITIPLPVSDPFRAEEQGVVKIIIIFAPVGKRLPCVENERQIQIEIFDTTLER